jgi:UDP-sulfoquinovose synthase
VASAPATDDRVFNQFAETRDVRELAERVHKVGASSGSRSRPDHEHLLALGYKPSHDMEGEIRQMLADLAKRRQRIIARKQVLLPDIRWDGSRRKVRHL